VEARIGLASSFLEVVMYRKFDPTQTEQFFNEANDIVSMVSTVMANEGLNLSSHDVYDLAERIERVRNLLLTVGDRMYFEESKDVA
jgi:hypothetical protein